MTLVCALADPLNNPQISNGTHSHRNLMLARFFPGDFTPLVEALSCMPDPRGGWSSEPDSPVQGRSNQQHPLIGANFDFEGYTPFILEFKREFASLVCHLHIERSVAVLEHDRNAVQRKLRFFGP